MWPTFFIRVRPASRNAKPACMNITSTAATTTQIVLAAIEIRARCCCDHPTSTSSSALPVRLCVTFVDRRRPDDPVARLVAAARRVGDRGDDRVGLSSSTTKIEQRLRQEARLEDAPAVLVRDAALAAVADRLDHGHADVARLPPRRRRSPSRSARGSPLPRPSSSDHLRSSFEQQHVAPHAVAARRAARARRRRGSRSRDGARRLALFSGKIPAWSVQMPAASASRSASRAARGRRRGPAPTRRRRRCPRRRRGSSSGRRRRERRPADDLLVELGDEPVLGVRRVPRLPRRHPVSNVALPVADAVARRSPRPPASPVGRRSRIAMQLEAAASLAIVSRGRTRRDAGAAARSRPRSRASSRSTCGSGPR